MGELPVGVAVNMGRLPLTWEKQVGYWVAHAPTPPPHAPPPQRKIIGNSEGEGGSKAVISKG